MGEKVKAKKKKRESCYFLIDSHEKEVLQFPDEQALGDTVESWLNEGDINLIADNFRNGNYTVIKGEVLDVSIKQPRELIVVKEGK